MNLIVLLILIIIKLIECNSKLPFFLNKYDLGTNTSSPNECTHFYNFICDKWKLNNRKPKSEPFWNQYTLLDEKINLRIRKLLVSDKSLMNEQKFYATCLDHRNDHLHLEQLRILIAKFGGFHLNNESLHNYDFIRHIIIVAKVLNVNPILKMYIDTHFKNHSMNLLYVKSGSFSFPQTILLNPSKHVRELRIYKQWIRMTLQEIYQNQTNIEHNSISDIINFEIALAKLDTNVDEQFELITLNALTQQHTRTTDWNALLKFLFENTTINVNRIETIAIKMNYLNSLFKLIANTAQRTISNYIVWSGVKDMTRDINANMRRINFNVDAHLLGVSKDVTREYECVQKLLEYLPENVELSYMKHFLHTQTFHHVFAMAKQIKNEFLEMLAQNQFLSDDGKMQLITKIHKIRFAIGIQKHQTTFNEHLSKNHFINLLKLKMHKQKMNLELLDDHSGGIKWMGHSLDVNAYYNTIQNAIILPMGLLSAPFYDINAPQISNYGALGSLIGHELSHALDLFDGLSLADQTHLVEHKKCFIRHYSAYGVDGLNTLGENVADFIGLTLSYQSYKKLFPDSKQDKLFFLAYGAMWCEHEGNELLGLDEHSPVKIRVLGALKNSKQFHFLFNCRNVSSPFCTLW